MKPRYWFPPKPEPGFSFWHRPWFHLIFPDFGEPFSWVIWPSEVSLLPNPPETVELLLLHALATIYMTGLIWFVQIVHYPLKAKVGLDQFRAYHEAHKTRTAWVVGPPMLLELACALWLVIAPPESMDRAAAVAGLIALGLIWFVTARYSMRYHATLEAGFDKGTHQLLVRTNWIRTTLWSARSGLALLFVLSASRP